ncbi:hypothetical protein GQ44DRAFT_726853 [Phaeosphaeriaceae sp. PMI808]|nr:hypothetical protein GQ44DRAFT_726853 [Phaeosphaeriaceae sp. PMI808]
MSNNANANQLNSQNSWAINGISSLSDSLGAAKSLKVAITTFASEDGFKLITHLVDTIPQLKKDVTGKDVRISELEAQLVAEKKDRVCEQQAHLKIYSEAYNRWKIEEGESKNAIDDLQKIIQEKNREISALQNDLGGSRAQICDLNTSLSSVTTSLNEAKNNLTALNKNLQQAKDKEKGQSTKLNELEKRVLHLEELLKQTRDEQGQLKAESGIVKERLSSLMNYSVPMKKLDVDKIAEELDTFWRTATLIVQKIFDKDLPEEILQDDWGKLRENPNVHFRLPLPQSNTDAAKGMRAIAVLTTLVRLIDKHIFQPSYLLDEGSGFRELLCHQATQDQKKERFIRGILLAMVPDQPDKYAKEHIRWISEDLFVGAGVNYILPREVKAAFEEDLNKLLGQIQVLWQTVQYGQQRLEPNFEYDHSSTPPWNHFGLQASRKGGKQSAPTLSADIQDDEAFVIFPRLYIMQSAPEPITGGTIVRKSQLRTAELELRSSLTNGPFSMSNPVQSRRKLSIHTENARGGRADKRIVSKSPVATYV